MGCFPPRAASPRCADVRPADPESSSRSSRGGRGGPRRDGVLQRGRVRSRRSFRDARGGGRLGRDRAVPVTAEINQLRDNYSRQIIAIQLTNTTAGPVTVLGARSPARSSAGTIEWPATPGGIELPPGQTKILPAQLSAPDCGHPDRRTERGSHRGTAAGRSQRNRARSDGARHRPLWRAEPEQRGNVPRPGGLRRRRDPAGTGTGSVGRRATCRAGARHHPAEHPRCRASRFNGNPDASTGSTGPP